MFFCCYCVQCFFYGSLKEGTHYIDKFDCVEGSRQAYKQRPFNVKAMARGPRLPTITETRRKKIFFFNKTGFVVLHTRHQSLGPFFSVKWRRVQISFTFLTSFYGTPFHLNLLRRTISSPSNQLRLMQQMARQRHR